MTNVTTAEIIMALNEVDPMYEYRGFPVYNICHILRAIKPLAPAGEWSHYHGELAEMFDEAVEVLDSVVYQYSRYEENMSEAVRLCLEESCRGIILEDLS